jgi:Mg-chelatase subunit ChlD
MKLKKFFTILIVITLCANSFSGVVCGDISSVATRTVSTTTPSYGDEVIINYTFQPESLTEEELDSPDKEVVILMDTSYNAGTSDNNDETSTKIESVKDSVQLFIENIASVNNVKVSLIQFNNYATVFSKDGSELLDLSDEANYNFIINSIDGLSGVEGKSNIGDALRRAYYVLNNDSGAEQYIVLITTQNSTAFSTTSMAYTLADESGIGRYYENKGESISEIATMNTIEYMESEGDAVNYFVSNSSSDPYSAAFEYATIIIDYLNADINRYYIAYQNDDGLNNLADLDAYGTSENASNATELDDILDSVTSDITANTTYITNVSYYEKFPDGIEVISLDSDSLTEESNVVTGNFEDIPYIYNESTGLYEAASITFNITVKVNKSAILGEDDSAYFTYDQTTAYLDTLGINMVNTAPVIVLYSPDTTTYVDETQEVDVSFLATDLEETTSHIKIYLEGQLMFEDEDYLNGTIISATYDSYTIDGNEVTVTIQATDSAGGMAETTIDLLTCTTDSISDVIRTFPADAYDADGNISADVMEEQEITYTFTGGNKEFSVITEQEIVLILNISNTMGIYLSTGSGDGSLPDAAKSLISNLVGTGDVKVGIVAYNETVKYKSDLLDINQSYNVDILYDGLDALEKHNGTNLGEGLRYAYQLLDNGSDAEKHIVILSDGFQNTGVITEESSAVAYANETWIDNIVYNTDLTSAVNEDIENDEAPDTDTGSYDKIGQAGIKSFKTLESGQSWDDIWIRYNDYNGDGVNDMFNIGTEYSQIISGLMLDSGIDFKAHMIHFERQLSQYYIDLGFGTDEEAQEINNETIKLLGATTVIDEEKDQYFYFASDADSIQGAFDSIAEVIGTSFYFDDLVYTETFPAGVEVVDYPVGMTYDEATNTLSGSLSDIKMVDSDGDGLYNVDGSFNITVKYLDAGTKVFDGGSITYVEPYESTDPKTVAISPDTVEASWYFDLFGSRTLTNTGGTEITEIGAWTPFNVNYNLTASDLIIASSDAEVNFTALEYEELFPENMVINGVSYVNSSGTTVDVAFVDVNATTRESTDGNFTITEVTVSGVSQYMLTINLANVFTIEKNPSDSKYSIDGQFTVVLENDDIGGVTYDFEDGDLVDYTAPDGQIGTVNFDPASIEVQLIIFEEDLI